MSTSSDPWRAAGKAAAARLNPKSYDDSDEHAVGHRLAAATNALRQLGDIPEVTTSFRSARLRSDWRDKAEPAQAELLDAVEAYAAQYGISPTEVGQQVTQALALDDEVVFTYADAEGDQLPEGDEGGDELPDDGDQDPDRPATMADAEAHFGDDSEASE